MVPARSPVAPEMVINYHQKFDLFVVRFAKRKVSVKEMRTDSSDVKKLARQPIFFVVNAIKEGNVVFLNPTWQMEIPCKQLDILRLKSERDGCLRDF